MPLAEIFLGERFGKWPWELKHEPADEVEFYLNVLSRYNEVLGDLEGVDPDDVVFWEDED